MKRGGPIPRRTRLRARKPSRTRQERAARDVVMLDRSGGVCEVCGRERAREYQHRKAEGQGGEVSVVNGLAVCGFGNTSGCHGRIHGNPTEAYAMGWSVRREHDAAAKPVQHAWLGWVLLLPDGSVAAADEAAA